MPTIGQKIDILFKKFIAYKSMVNIAGGDSNSFTPNTIPFNLESYGSKLKIASNQIWSDSNNLPKTFNPLNKSLLPNQYTIYPSSYTINNTNQNEPIVMYLGNPLFQRLDLQLTYISGSTYSWSLNGINNYNIIPFSFDNTGTIYRYELYATQTNIADPIWGTTYTLSNEIVFGLNDWFFDQDGLVLNFLSETLPYNVFTTNNLYLRVYNYIGNLGLISSSSSSISSNSAWSLNTIGNDWQNAVIDIVNILPISPSNGERYIITQNINNVNVYNILTDLSITANITINSIIQYWDKTINNTNNGGWIVLNPHNGIITNVINNNNKIIKYIGGNWEYLNWELSKDFKIENPTITIHDGDLINVSPLTDIPTGNISVTVEVNGIDAIIGNGCTSITFSSPNYNILFAKQYSYSYNNTSTIIINNIDFIVGQSLIINDNGINKCFDITNITGNIVTINGVLSGGTINSVVRPKHWGDIQQGDIILWFGSFSGYQLDSTDYIVTKYIINN